ncbi:hypothetical protein ACYOEI_17205, partial [Singulisphaera rosea]
MKEYWFSVIVEGPEELTDEVVDKLYEAGCDDGTVSTRDTVHRIGFAREALSFHEAVGTAIAHIEGAGAGLTV